MGGPWGFPRSGNERAAPLSLPVNLAFPRWCVAPPGVAGRGAGVRALVLVASVSWLPSGLSSWRPAAGRLGGPLPE
jgi:hypothetical protein